MSNAPPEPIVYITQVPNRRDRETGMMVPSVNIGPAAKHGRVQILMPPNAPFFATQDLLSQLRTGLRDYNFKRGDSLIVLGDPAISAVAGAVLSEVSNQWRILKWDRLSGVYVPVEVRIR